MLLVLTSILDFVERLGILVFVTCQSNFFIFAVVYWLFINQGCFILFRWNLRKVFVCLRSQLLLWLKVRGELLSLS